MDSLASISPDPTPMGAKYTESKITLSDSQDMKMAPFMGGDVDAYIASHADRYEAAKKRWANCSREEWEAGADGRDLLHNFFLAFILPYTNQRRTYGKSLQSAGFRTSRLLSLHLIYTSIH